MEKIKVISKLNQRAGLNRSFAGNMATFFMLFLLALFTGFPLYLMIINSFKPLNELWIFPPKFYVINPTFDNYKDLLTVMGSSTVPFLKYVFNTVFITAAGTIGQILLTSMCAYALAKIDFPGRKIYFSIVVFSLMFSSAVTGIPIYMIMAKIGWIDTFFALIVPVFGSSIGLYLMKQFIEQINDSILEAARIDGAKEFRIFWTIVMPLVKGAWLTLMIFAIQGLWGMGSSNMIFSENLKTLNYAMSQIVAAGIARAGIATAIGVVMLGVPVIAFIFSQSNVIETMSNSGMKD